MPPSRRVIGSGVPNTLGPLPLKFYLLDAQHFRCLLLKAELKFGNPRISEQDTTISKISRGSAYNSVQALLQHKCHACELLLSLSLKP